MEKPYFGRTTDMTRTIAKDNMGFCSLKKRNPFLGKVSGKRMKAIVTVLSLIISPHPPSSIHNEMLSNLLSQHRKKSAPTRSHQHKQS